MTAMIKGKRLLDLSEMRDCPTKEEITDLAATYMAAINSQTKNKPTEDDGIDAVNAANLIKSYCKRWESGCGCCVFQSKGTGTCALAWGEKSIHNPTQWKV